MEGLSSVLKRRRKDLGLTLLQIAEKMGVSEATVQRWESGSIKMLRHERITELAQILQVPPSTLMGWGSDDSLNAKSLPILKQTALTPEEFQLVQGYRSLDPRGQSAVQATLEHELQASRQGGS